MNKSLLLACAVSTLILSAASSFAAPANDWGVNLKAGTLGAGVEMSKSLGDKFSAGLGFNSYNYKTTDSASGIDYDYKLELQSASQIGRASCRERV